MASSLPTRGQLERSISQHIQAFYRNELGHRLSQISCEIVENKVFIVLEKSVTLTELLLVNSGKEELVQEIRTGLDEVMRPNIQKIIEEAVGISVNDLLSDVTVETERMGIIAILAEIPQFRDRATAGKTSASVATVKE